MKEKLFNDNVASANRISNYKLYDFCSNIQEANESLYYSLNFIGSDIINFMTWKERLIRFLQFNHYKVYLFIFCVSSLASVLFISIEKLSQKVQELKIVYILPNFLVFLLFNVVCGCFATFVCQMISPQAQGSGIPEIRTIMTGVEYDNFFSARTGVAKYISIFFVRIAGIGIGFEAAFFHISAIIGDCFQQTKYFSDIRKKEYRLAIISSVGMSLVIAYGAPIGGVILALELFSDNIEMHRLLKTFFASTIAYFFYTILNNIFYFQNIDGIFENQKMSSLKIDYRETPLFIGCGVFCGSIASMFLFLYTYFLGKKLKSHSPLFD